MNFPFREFIGEQFVVHSGYLGVAEANNIIVIFPQIKKSLMLPTNPNGCYDWWGYDEAEIFYPPYGMYYTSIDDKYISDKLDIKWKLMNPLLFYFAATKEGKQVKAIKAMIDRVMGQETCQ